MVLIVGSATALILTGGAAAPIVATVLAEGTAVSAAGAGAVVGVASTTAGVTALGAGVAAGTAISTAGGACATAAVSGATVAALTGASATGIVTAAAAEATAAALIAGASGAGAAVTTGAAATVGAPVAAAIISGPVGWCILGADELIYSWDCWKEVLHDFDTVPSNGKMLKDFVMDPRLKSITIAPDESSTNLLIFPASTCTSKDGQAFLATNIWDESFLLNAVVVKGKVAYHASRVLC